MQELRNPEIRRHHGDTGKTAIPRIFVVITAAHVGVLIAGVIPDVILESAAQVALYAGETLIEMGDIDPGVVVLGDPVG